MWQGNVGPSLDEASQGRQQADQEAHVGGPQHATANGSHHILPQGTDKL